MRQQAQRYTYPWTPYQVTWVCSHNIVRGYKVIINVYDLFNPLCNRE